MPPMPIRTAKRNRKAPFQRWREDKGLTVAAVAKAAKVTFRAAKFWDKGTFKPRGAQIKNLVSSLKAEGYEITSDEILAL